MAQPIGQDETRSSDQAGDYPEIRQVAGPEYQCGLCPFKGGKGSFQFFMGGECSANQARGTGSRTVSFRRADRRMDDVRVSGQSEVIVGAEENHALS